MISGFHNWSSTFLVGSLMIQFWSVTDFEFSNFYWWLYLQNFWCTCWPCLNPKSKFGSHFRAFRNEFQIHTENWRHQIQFCKFIVCMLWELSHFYLYIYPSYRSKLQATSTDWIEAFFFSILDCLSIASRIWQLEWRRVQ